MCLLCFIVIFLLGCSLYLLLWWTYTTPKAFGLYFKGPSSSVGLVIPYSIWEHQNFPLNNLLYHNVCYFQMKKKTKAAILTSIASILLVGVTLFRKLQHKQLHRASYVNHATKGKHYINGILHRSERHYVSQIRMKPIVFQQLCDILTQGEHIQPTVHMFVRE